MGRFKTDGAANQRPEKDGRAAAGFLLIVTMSLAVHKKPSAEAESQARVAPQSVPSPVPGAQRRGAKNCVDLRTASAAALARLPGIGKTRASAILKYRKKHKGPFLLKDIRGIGPAIQQKAQKYVCADERPRKKTER